MFLNELTGKNRIEDSNFECKSILNNQDIIGWLKTIAGFANSRHEHIDITYELSNIISKRINELISAILVACRVMEAAGTGFDKISEEYAPYDDMHRSYIYSKSDHFTLVLPDLTYENGVVDSNVPIVEFPPVNNGSEYDDKILSYCYYTPRKVAKTTKYLGISNSTYFRKQVLMNLVSNNYLIMKKEGNASYYFSNRTYIRLK